MDTFKLLKHCREYVKDIIALGGDYAEDESLLDDINDAIEELEFKG